MTEKRRDALLLAIPVCTIFVMLENHYIRDTVGALEKQMETDLGMTPEEYSTLNSLYFMPNIVAPLFIGIFCEISGRASKLLLFTAVALALGNIIFTIGAHTHSLSLFYTGRFIAGCMYEVIDTIPIIILGPLFRENWGLMVGLMNGMLRFGTVLTFAISPLVYRHYGVEPALWISSLMGVLGIVAALAAYLADVWLESANLALDAAKQEAEEAEGGASECEMVTYQQLEYERDSASPMEVHSRSDHGPTRKSIEYYQALQAQVESDPLEDSVDIPHNLSSTSSHGHHHPPSDPQHPHYHQQQQQHQLQHQSRSDDAAHGRMRSRSTSLENAVCSPLGARFTPRNVSLLHAEANAGVHLVGNRKRIFSEDAASANAAGAGAGGNQGEFDRFGVFDAHPVEHMYGHGHTESTPLVLHQQQHQQQHGNSHHYGEARREAQSHNNYNSSSSGDSGGESGKGQDASSVSMLQTIWEYLVTASPFQDYGVQFYFYLLNSMCLFGAVVPFWFTGSKFLQLNYGLSVESADFLMILPEGVMVVISPLLGVVVDYLRMTLANKLYLMGAVGFGTGVAFLMLALCYPGSSSGMVAIDPLYTILLLSCCYSCANSLTWDVVIQVVPDPDKLAPATGLSASGANLLPCLVPYVTILLIRHFGSGVNSSGGGGADGVEGPQSNVGMLVLAATAGLAGVFGVCAALCNARTYDADILEQTGLAGRGESSKSGSSSRDKRNRDSCGSEYEII